jgi:hypothetical protein
MSRPMHPDIKKFWEDIGTVEISMDAYLNYDCWYVKIENILPHQIIARRWRHNPIQYFFGDKEYTEQQMLRMIKLKAFL